MEYLGIGIEQTNADTASPYLGGIRLAECRKIRHSMMPICTLPTAHCQYPLPAAPQPNALCPLPIVHCLLLNVCCQLPSIYCPLFSAYCLLSTAYSLLSSVSLLAVHCPLSIAHCALSTDHCPQSTRLSVHCPLTSAHSAPSSLSTVHRPLPTAQSPFSTASYPLCMLHFRCLFGPAAFNMPTACKNFFKRYTQWALLKNIMAGWQCRRKVKPVSLLLPIVHQVRPVSAFLYRGYCSLVPQITKVRQ